jgi:hypothetical protein
MTQTPFPTALEEHAAEHLRFIRRTIERSASFTAVPGWGGAAMGGTALVAAPVAALQPTPRAWLAVWLAEAAVAFAVGAWATARKAVRSGQPLGSQPARRFALALLPAFVAGAVLTAGLVAAGRADLLPPLWLLLYGAGVTSGSAHSVPAIPAMGIAFMALSVVALAAPAWHAALSRSLRRRSPGLRGLHREAGTVAKARAARRPGPAAGGETRPAAALELDRLIHERVRLGSSARSPVAARG